MKKAKKTVVAKETSLNLNMTYEQAMKKALNTPLPKKVEKKRKQA